MEECKWKLVRDRIGEEIASKGGHVEKAEPGEAERLLLEKIVEEALELRDSGDPEEAADLLEALESWARLRGMSLGDIARIASEKRKFKGGFDKLYKARICRANLQS